MRCLWICGQFFAEAEAKFEFNGLDLCDGHAHVSGYGSA
jgi:hypothetical protein